MIRIQCKYWIKLKHLSMDYLIHHVYKKLKKNKNMFSHAKFFFSKILCRSTFLYSGKTIRSTIIWQIDVWQTDHICITFTFVFSKKNDPLLIPFTNFTQILIIAYNYLHCLHINIIYIYNIRIIYYIVIYYIYIIYILYCNYYIYFKIRKL